MDRNEIIAMATQQDRSLDMLLAAMEPDVSMLEVINYSIDMQMDLRSAEKAMQREVKRVCEGRAYSEDMIVAAATFGIAHGLSEMLRAIVANGFGEQGEVA